MFTDQPVTPARLEVLVNLVRALQSEQRVLTPTVLYNLLQPETLEKVDAQRVQAKSCVQAARELGLITDEGDRIGWDRAAAGLRETRELVLEAFDHKVLAETQIEPYFAKFYSYLLNKGSTTAGKDRDTWAREFNRDVFNDQLPSNPFNKEKFTGLQRWVRWAGLGWYDSTDEFHCNPYDRIRRRLPAVFGDHDRLDDDAFIAALGRACPEIDGGAIFEEVATSAGRTGHQLSAGLAQALLELHADGIIRLHGAVDAEGWGLEQADPTGVDGPRLHAVELLLRRN